MKDILLETDSATQKFVNFTMKPAEMADKFCLEPDMEGMRDGVYGQASGSAAGD